MQTDLHTWTTTLHPGSNIAMSRWVMAVALLLSFADSQARQQDAHLPYLAAPTQARTAIVDGLVSIHADNTPIADILASLAHHIPLTVTTYAPLDARVSLDMQGVPLPNAVRRLLKSRNFALRYRPQTTQLGGHAGDARPMHMWIFPDAANTTMRSTPRTVNSRPLTAVPSPSPGPLAGDSPASPLADVWLNPDPRARSAAVADLTELATEAAVLELAVALGDTNPGVREVAVEGLGAIGDTTAIHLVAQALGDANARVRRAAIDALGDAGTREAVHALGIALRDPDAGLRQIAVDMLGEIGTTESQALLHQALRDHNAEVRQSAQKVIGQREGRQQRR